MFTLGFWKAWSRFGFRFSLENKMKHLIKKGKLNKLSAALLAAMFSLSTTYPFFDSTSNRLAGNNLLFPFFHIRDYIWNQIKENQNMNLQKPQVRTVFSLYTRIRYKCNVSSAANHQCKGPSLPTPEHLIGSYPFVSSPVNNKYLVNLLCRIRHLIFTAHTSNNLWLFLSELCR